MMDEQEDRSQDPGEITTEITQSTKLEKPDYLKRNELMSDDCLTPLIENSRSEYDLETTTRKLALKSQEIDEDYEKQCYGSQPPSS